jgi:hypothetical protein
MHMTSPYQAAYEQPSKVIYDLGANTGDDIADYLKSRALIICEQIIMNAKLF